MCSIIFSSNDPVVLRGKLISVDVSGYNILKTCEGCTGFKPKLNKLRTHDCNSYFISIIK